MEIVYIEAVLMPNNELIHFGKSLGYVSDYQASLVEAKAAKRTRGNEFVVSLRDVKDAA